MTLHIVRHGRTVANASGLLLGRADPDLDEVGRAQAASLASALGRPSRVVSSPLARCRQTAEAFGVEVEIDERLIELDYGELDLTPVREVPGEMWRRWRADPQFRPPGGETLAELHDRVGRCLDDLWSARPTHGARLSGGTLSAEKAGGPGPDGERADGGRIGPIVVVTHVSPVKAAVAWALGVSIAISWRSFVSPASVTTIGSGADGGPSLHLFNGTAHLD